MQWLRHGALSIGVASILVGFWLHDPWSSALLQHFDAVALALLGLGLAGSVLARLARWPLAAGLLAISLLAHLRFHGFAAVVVALLFLAVALGLGARLIGAARPGASPRGRATPAEDSGDGDAPWWSLCVGTAAMGATAGWLLPFPIFSQAAVAAVLVLALIVLRRDAAHQLRALWRLLDASCRESPRASAAAAAVLLIASVPSWLPVMSADDLATHLQIGWQLQVHGHYRMDVGSQAWSLAPWLADALYGLLLLLAGREVAPTFNLLWLIVTLLLVQRIGRVIGLSPAFAWLGAMLYASTPLVGALTMGMQTETLSAAFVAALALVVLRAPPHAEARTLWVAGLLSAGLIGMKILNGAFVLPLAVLLLWRWRGAVPWSALPRAFGAGALVAGPSYFYATVLAGNPLLPMFNGAFASPWFPAENHVDPRWHAGFDWALPYWLSFRTADYYEPTGIAGAAGFALLLLALGAVAAATDRRLRPLLLAALAAWLIPFIQIQYLRYTLPALVLLLPLLLAGLATSPKSRGLLLSGAAVVLLNLLFQASGSYVTARDGMARLLDSREALLAEMAPERLIADVVRLRHRDADRLLLTDPDFPSIAEFAGRAFTLSWYDHALWQETRERPDDLAAWQRVVERSGANLVVARRDTLYPGLRALLVGAGAQRLAEFGPATLYELPPRRTAGELLEARPGQVALRFPASLEGDRLVDVRIELDCSLPFAPVALGWTAYRLHGDAGWARHRWMTCPADGRLVVDLSLALPAGWGRVEFEAEPVAGFGEQVIRVAGQGQLQRTDLARSRDLSRVARQQVCRRWKMCRELERPLLLGSG